MDASHARPMTAYAALCAAAVVVLAQGVSSSGPVADAIAQAGPPALGYAQTFTFAATEQITRRVGDLSTAVAATSAAPALAAAQQRTTGGARAQDSTEPVRQASATLVAEPVRIQPATTVRGSGPARTHERASAERKVDRTSARDARKAHRAAAKDARKAHRAARHGR